MAASTSASSGCVVPAVCCRQSCTMMGGVAVYMALFNRQPQGRTRGDFLGGLFYGSNWYQIFVGQGYTAGEAFVPVAAPVVAGGGGAVLSDLAAA